MRINNLKKDKVKEEPKEMKSPNWFDKNKFKEILAIIDSNQFNFKNKIGKFGLIKISLKKFQPLLTATNLISRIKQANLSILTLKSWLIILEIIQLVKQMLKKFKCIKRNNKCRNNKI